jgi:hypothetical protein
MSKSKTKYLTAAKLGILPEERAALIAFVESPTYGRVVVVNGKGHLYDQGAVEDPDEAKRHECGTAGCVAGYVFAHARHVQGVKRLRGARDADGYIDTAWNTVEDQRTGDEKPVVPLLHALYGEGNERKLGEARKVVAKALRTGKVKWPAPPDDTRGGSLSSIIGWL